MPDTTLTSAELLDKLDDLVAKCTDQDAPGSAIYFTIGRLQQLLTGDQRAFSQLRTLLSLARAGLEAGKAEESMRGGLTVFSQDTRLSLEFHQKIYGDDDDLPTHGKWVIWRETGNMNDREWAVVCFGDGPADAIRALPLTGGDKP